MSESLVQRGHGSGGRNAVGNIRRAVTKEILLLSVLLLLLLLFFNPSLMLQVGWSA